MFSEYGVSSGVGGNVLDMDGGAHHNVNGLNATKLYP